MIDRIHEHPDEQSGHLDASANGHGSGEMCPSCGFDFTGVVDEARYAEWREQWVRGGMAWWAAQAGRPAPYDWNPTTQLKALTG